MASLRRLPGTPWTRLVLDIDRSHPSALGPYAAATRRLSSVSHVIAELADSSELRELTVRQMARRTTAYVRALQGDAAAWEVGNEVNGNWTGHPATVARKVAVAYHRVHHAGDATALTLYENQGCGDGPHELTPTAWSRRYLTTRTRAGIDDVLLSYYEAQCHGRRPSRAVWTQRFQALHRLFPHASVGFGEIGMPHPAGPRTSARARSIIRYYYGLDVPLPYFIGGDFYWYYVEDMTPWQHSPLWRDLRSAFTQR